LIVYHRYSIICAIEFCKPLYSIKIMAIYTSHKITNWYKLLRIVRPINCEAGGLDPINLRKYLQISGDDRAHGEDNRTYRQAGKGVIVFRPYVQKHHHGKGRANTCKLERKRSLFSCSGVLSSVHLKPFGRLTLTHGGIYDNII
jgi:hypothetical protein